MTFGKYHIVRVLSISFGPIFNSVSRSVCLLECCWLHCTPTRACPSALGNESNRQPIGGNGNSCSTWLAIEWHCCGLIVADLRLGGWWQHLLISYSVFTVATKPRSHSLLLPMPIVWPHQPLTGDKIVIYVSDWAPTKSYHYLGNTKRMWSTSVALLICDHLGDISSNDRSDSEEIYVDSRGHPLADDVLSVNNGLITVYLFVYLPNLRITNTPRPHRVVSVESLHRADSMTTFDGCEYQGQSPLPRPPLD